MGKQTDLDNHANQLNPNHDAFRQSRGEDGHPTTGRNGAKNPGRTSRKTQSARPDSARRGA